jgi:hypothetical protein
MNYLLRQGIWPSFLASSVVGPCDVPFRYGNQHPAVARWHAHLPSLATAIHEMSGPEVKINECGRDNGKTWLSPFSKLRRRSMVYEVHPV